MSATINDLVQAINCLLAEPEVQTHASVGKDGCTYICNPDEASQVYLTRHNLVEALANELLITEDGQPNYEKHRELKALGFPVLRGEYDSFGWLSGMISTPVGYFVYG